MHHLYTTPGFIVSSKPHAEAGKFFLIFTRDLGMVGATAQGIRFVQSKLRYHTQDYSYNLFSLVRGKEVWRLTGAKELLSSSLLITDEENKRIYIRVLTLLKRFLAGEEKNEKLFETIDVLYRTLSTEISKEDRECIELLTVLRILFHLGYISHKDSFNDLVATTDIYGELFEKVKVSRSLILKEINNALKESHL